MKNCTLRQRLSMEDLWLIFTSEGNHVYCVGLVNGDKIILQYSGPRSLKAIVTSRRAKGWKDLRKIIWSVTVPSAPRTLRAKGDRTTLCCLLFAVVSDKLDLSSTEGRLDKEKYSFNIVSINQCAWLQRFVGIVHSFNFRSLRDSRPFFASHTVFLRSNLCRVRRNGHYK